MKYSILIFALPLFLSSCAHRNKADKIETKLDNQSSINKSEGSSVGVRDKEFVIQNKKNLNEELRKLKNEVQELEDRVYGTREFKTWGLWGKLRDCRMKKNNASEFEAGPIERTYEKEYLLNWKENSKAKAGIEKSSGQLVAISEEDLDDHIKKLNKMKIKLQEKEDEISEKLGKCLAANSAQ